MDFAIAVDCDRLKLFGLRVVLVSDINMDIKGIIVVDAIR